MPYLTYRNDVRRSVRELRGPGKKWAKSLTKISDPGPLFFGTMEFFAHAWWAFLKICFFTVRRLFG